MSKISVGETILQAYGFAARRILSNFGLVWLAAVFYAAAAGYWLQQFCTTMLVSPHPGSELNDFALFDLLGFVVTTAFASAVIARTLTGAALEPGAETMTAYFAVAKREWILFLSVLRLYASVIATLFAVVLLGGLAIKMALPMIGASAQWQGISALQAMNVAVGMVAFAVTATLAVRLGFFAAPAASAEHSLSMARVWSLSRGNSWRVFAIMMGLSVPALLLWAAAEWALIGNGHSNNALYQSLNDNAAAIVGIWTALIVVLNMFFAGASAPAYLTVRDNVSERQQSVQRAPALEPAFAGSFAGFAPRQIEEPAASDVTPHMETFTAAPEHDASVAMAEMHAETFATESEPALPQVEEPALPPADEHHAPDVHEENAHEPMVLDDEMHEAPVVQDEIAAEPTGFAQFPLEHDSAAGQPADHVEAAPAEAAPTEPQMEEGAFTPLPSHGDATESSQQNAPSEAA